MTDFAAALQGYKDGTQGKEDLLAAVDRAVDGGASDPLILLTTLYQSDEQAPLARSVRDSVEMRILRWIHKTADGPSDTTDWPLTVVLEQQPTVGRNAPGGAPAESARARARAAMRAGPAPGDILLGRFRLIDRIGIGGMSIVYKAIDLRRVEGGAHDPHIALKVLTLPLKDYSHALALLQQEAQKLQQVPHASIVRVMDCDRDGATVFMTMEYLDGRSLDRIFRAPGFKGLPEVEADRIVGAIATALDAAHAAGMVHGDLKPGNVMLTATGEVKLIDFGIAQVIQGERMASQTGARSALEGITPRYASPEALERQSADPRDDIYALACIAYELLSGERPFKTLTAIQARDAGLRPRRTDGMSPRQFAAIAHGLSFDREARTPTAAKFQREFQAQKRRSSLRLAVAAAAVVAIGIASWLALQPRGEPAAAVVQAVTPAAPNYQPGVVFRDCPTCPLMVPIPAGSFDQGTAAVDAEALASELPRHRVILRAMFGMGATEVSVAEYRQFRDDTDTGGTSDATSGCDGYDGKWAVRSDIDWKNPGFVQSASHPVTCVSWTDARAYAQWLSRRTGHPYRLPSASEWEYAARARSLEKSPWSAAAAQACQLANTADATATQRYPGWTARPCADGNIFTAPVASYQANAFGLYDMLGNVFEWVEDCWVDDYRQAPTDGSARETDGCAERESRGGSWFTAPAYVRFAYRNRFADGYRSTTMGFRLVRELPQ